MDADRLRVLREATGASEDETISYLYNPNNQRLADSSSLRGGTAYSYDDNGSLIATTGAKTASYGYDLRNRMVSATVDGVSAEFAYNDAGIRVMRNENGVVSHHLVDHNNPTGYAQVLGEKSSTAPEATPDKSYVIGQDVLAQAVAEAAGAVLQWLAADGHGSTRQLLDEVAAILQRYDFDAFGQALRFTDAAGQPITPQQALTNLLYVGEQFDRLLKWSYNRARYYDFSTGRFPTSDDPTYGRNGSPATLHKYLCAHGDPLTGSDPSGNSRLLELLFTVGIILAVVKIYLVTGLVRGAVSGPSQVTGNAGMDITTYLERLRPEVLRRVAKLPQATYRKLLDENGNPYHAAQNWDITELYQSGGGKDDNGNPGQDYFKFRTGSVAGTVTVNQKAHWSGEVNYYHYGALLAAIDERNGTPNASLDWGISKAMVWRGGVAWGGGTNGRVAWIMAGYYGDLSYADRAALPNVAPSTAQYSGLMFAWWGVEYDLQIQLTEKGASGQP
jgi:RHS repeat-associated protein